MSGLAAARRASASADTESLSGESTTAMRTARPRRRKTLASSTMGFSAASASSLRAATRVLSSFPTSDSITSLTFFSTSSALTKPVSYPCISIPTPMPSVMNTLFIFCSAYSGQHNIGTPAVRPSMVEFHPQWVTNAPVARWLSTSACGAHDVTTRPRSLVRSKNLSGRSASMSGSLCPCKSILGSSTLAAVMGTTHRNRCLDLSRPTAISLICSAENAPMLPKQRNTTLRSGCASSHTRHSCLSASASPPFRAPPPPTNGPTQYIGGTALPGTQRVSLSACTARRSSDSNVFTRTPLESMPRSKMLSMVLHSSSSGCSSSSATR
ncbi:hypothetical protein U9M48_017794 [Paspalum notatum var. saurae]|uniref:Uncharacterized protein n=1 Tax=Paspalum notatum var. saurae TaxID=547442 RepID=A0AAQ3TBN9_PASNO